MRLSSTVPPSRPWSSAPGCASRAHALLPPTRAAASAGRGPWPSASRWPVGAMGSARRSSCPCRGLSGLCHGLGGCFPVGSTTLERWHAGTQAFRAQPQLSMWVTGAGYLQGCGERGHALGPLSIVWACARGLAPSVVALTTTIAVYATTRATGAVVVVDIVEVFVHVSFFLRGGCAGACGPSCCFSVR